MLNRSLAFAPDILGPSICGLFFSVTCHKGCLGPEIEGSITHTWGRTYWGGALFCLMADVEIRKQTGNKRGLEDAMRGILKSGGSIEVEWPLERALQVGDQAAGLSVLEDLYNKMRATPMAPDLNQLWKELGV